MKTGIILFLSLLLMSSKALLAQSVPGSDGPVKNVILMIPDGASIDLISLTRWLNDNQPLAIDPLITGLIKTHNADNRFPDSAPTSTAFATGHKSITPYIGIDQEAQPRISVLELARLKGLSTGIVATCEFPHATPSDFVCHFSSRESRKYKNLARQFVYNSPSLVFAGGAHYLEANGLANDLLSTGFRLITDPKDFRANADEKLWALFPDHLGNTRHLSYNCDRNPSTEPALSEMTEKAIQILSKNPNGFFLMVEGSQIDWACHYNDPYAAVTDFLEFDRAVSKALEFAKSEGKTLVIVCPDHGNGGISLGNKQSHTSFAWDNPNKYDNVLIPNDIVRPLKDNAKTRISGRKLAGLIIENPQYADPDSLNKFFNIKGHETTQRIKGIDPNYSRDDLQDTIQYLLGSTYSAQNFIGWTTTGHTAEDVFLGIYSPAGCQSLSGVVDNTDIAKFIAKSLNLGNLDDSSQKYFSSHKNLFTGAEILSINPDSLLVKKNGIMLTLYANTNRFSLTKNRKIKQQSLSTIIVAINREKGRLEYFLPESIIRWLE